MKVILYTDIANSLNPLFATFDLNWFLFDIIAYFKKS